MGKELDLDDVAAQSGLAMRQLAYLNKLAERYRWLRAAGAWESEIGMDALSEDPLAFDAAVDAAMAESRK